MQAITGSHSPHPDPAATGLRVLQVMSGPGMGGIETFFFDAVTALAEAGLAQFVVVHSDAPARQTDRLAAAAIPFATARFDKWFPWATRRAFEKARTDFRPNVAQFWTGRAGRFAMRTSACVNIGWFGGYRQMKDFKACDDFIAITPDLMRHLAEGGAEPARTALIHTFSALVSSAPQLVQRAAFNTPQDAPLLLILARLHAKKGIDTALHALAAVPGAYLWVAGEGPERANYEALAKSLGLESRVRFLGWRDDRAGLLAAADICLMPSRYEPFGTVMVEAWAAGVPLIVAAAQGPRAYVRDGINGLMVPVDDAPALATAIARVIADPDLRARLIAGGRDSYHAAFTREAYVRETLAFYRVVAGREDLI